MNTGDTVRGRSDTYTITGPFEDMPNGLVWRAQPRQQVDREVLIAAPIFGGQDLARVHANVDALKRLSQAGQLVWLVDWSETGELLLVLEPPSGASLPELAVQHGLLPEAEALLFLRQLAGLLEAMHTEANAALALSALEQTHWDREGQRIWLPLWHDMALAPNVERQTMDLTQAGVLAHLALLGRPPTTLWGEPVVLDELPAASDALSRGAWRLLRRLLHPDPASRLAAAAELVRVLDPLLNAWQDEPDQLSGAAQELFDQAQAGAVEKAWQADAIVDILERRGLEMPITFDWLKEDVESFVQRRQAIENALHLTRAGSTAAAAEQLRAAPAPAGGDLPLRRWLALLASLDAHWFDANSAVDQPLHGVVQALEVGDLEAATVALGALTDPPASLAHELALRTAWRAAVSQAGDADAAVKSLDAAVIALGKIADLDLRAALDKNLGGLARWRQRAATAEAAGTRAARIDEACERLQSARQQARWSDAIAALHAALALYPNEPGLLEEGLLLGADCLTAHQPQKAREAFALIAGQISDQRLARLGWRVAQAQVALSIDPASEASLARVRLAVDQCLQLTSADPASLAIVESLRAELAAAAALAERMNDLASSAALRNELRRLTTIAVDATGRSNALLALEAAIQHALAENEAAALGVLARFSPSAPVAAASNATGEQSSALAEPVNDRPGTVVEKSTGLLGRLFKSSTPAPENASSGTANSPSAPMAEHMLKRLISIHFDQVSAALDDLEHDALEEADTAKLTRWTEQARKVLADHRRGMDRVVQLSAAGAVGQAQQELRKATRGDKSRSCWDPKTSSWVPVSHWQFRLNRPSIEQVIGDLNSPEPERWAKVLRLSVGALELWPADLQRAARQRQKDLDRHQSELTYILKDATVDPAATLQAFEAWESHWANPMLCWDAPHSRWAAPGEILADLRIAAAHSTQRSPATPFARPKPATTTNDAILEALNSNDPQRWEQVTNTPTAQRTSWTPEIIKLASGRTKDLMLHRREMEAVLQGFATDPIRVKERMMKWRSTNRCATNWDLRNETWVPADELWQEIERAADTVQARKWLDVANQRLRGSPRGDVQDAIARGQAFAKADPAVLTELQSLLEQIKRPSATAGVFGAQANDSTQLSQPVSRSHPPGSLDALLEAHLRESETLSHLHIRLSALTWDKTKYHREISKMEQDLQIWVEEERWLGIIEEQQRSGRLQETSKSHAKNAIRNLESLIRTGAWHPYVTMETPAFANMHQRLEAISGPLERNVSSASSIQDLLAVPLRESATLKELQARLDALAVGEPRHNAQLERLISRLRLWLDEERWLDGIEQNNAGQSDQRTRGRAQKTIADLDALIATDQFWSPFITNDTPAFANVRRRLLTLAESSSPSEKSVSPSSDNLHALLEAPLRESETLTQLHNRLSALAPTDTRHERSIEKLAGLLRVWVEEERWLINAEEPQGNSRISETSKTHAMSAIRSLEAMIHSEAWRQYVTTETLAFANMRRRLQAIVSSKVSAWQSESMASPVPPRPAIADKAPQLNAPSGKQQTATSRKAPVKTAPPAPVKNTKPLVQTADAQPVKSLSPSKTNGASIAVDEQFQDQLRKTLRNTNSLTIVQARLEAMAVVNKDYEPELTHLLDEIVALRAAEQELDDILKLSGRPPDAASARRAAEVQTRIAALSLPIRPKAIKDLEKKAQTVQHLAKP